MKRIIMHWTAGRYKATANESIHYHFLVEDDGRIVLGYNDPADNEDCKDGRYAAHTQGCNTGSIGIAICAMFNAKESYPSKCEYQPTKNQIDALCKKVAELCLKYKIPVTNKTVLCHSEVQRNLGVKQNGKWDIDWLPWSIAPFTVVGDYLRDRIKKLVSEASDAIILAQAE